MLICFSYRDHDKNKTEFKSQLKEGIKDHTMRASDRWKPGMKLHMWENNPRNTTTDPEPIFLPWHRAKYWHHFASNSIIEVQGSSQKYKPIEFDDFDDKTYVKHYEAVPLVYATEKVVIQRLDTTSPVIFIGNKILTPGEMSRLAKRDGFYGEYEDMFTFLRAKTQDSKDKGTLRLQLIHWTTNGLYNAREAYVFNPLVWAKNKPKK